MTFAEIEHLLRLARQDKEEALAAGLAADEQGQQGEAIRQAVLVGHAAGRIWTLELLKQWKEEGH